MSQPPHLRLKWLFFDIGGVLMDEAKTMRHFASTIQGLLADHGIRTSAEAVERVQLKAAHNFGSVTLAVIAALTSDKAIGNRIYGEVWKSVRNLDEPYPEAKEVLGQLHERFGLGVIANQLPGSRERLRRFGFSQYLSVYALSDELHVSKPDAAIFRYALRAADCRPEEAAMIGDRVDNDILPARRLGMRAVRVRRGLFLGQRPGAEPPDAVIGSLRDLIGLELLK